MKVMELRCYHKNIKKSYARNWACILLLYFVLPQNHLHFGRQGWLTDLIYGSAEKAQTCFKNIAMKREQDGDLISIKIPKIFSFFIHISTEGK